jgi:hypothetical protein
MRKKRIKKYKKVFGNCVLDFNLCTHQRVWVLHFLKNVLSTLLVVSSSARLLFSAVQSISILESSSHCLPSLFPFPEKNTQGRDIPNSGIREDSNSISPPPHPPTTPPPPPHPPPRLSGPNILPFYSNYTSSLRTWENLIFNCGPFRELLTRLVLKTGGQARHKCKVNMCGLVNSGPMTFVLFSFL